MGDHSDVMATLLVSLMASSGDYEPRVDGTCHVLLHLVIV